MTTYPKALIGMHHLNITQIGSGYDGLNHYSHSSYEVDLAGSDAGIDYWKNISQDLYWKCAGALGNQSTGNTRFFWSCDANGNPKSVYCADGRLRVLTLALTHSFRNFPIGHIFAPNEVMYQEGTSGNATGNHIHLEVCEGQVARKESNSKGFYTLPNMLPANAVFFVYSPYTTVVTTDGLTFKTTDSMTQEVGDNDNCVFGAGNLVCIVDAVNVRTAPNRGAEIRAQYKRNLEVNIDSVVKNDGYWWGHYKSRSGIDSYIALYPVGTSNYYWKVGASVSEPSQNSGGFAYSGRAICIVDAVVIRSAPNTLHASNVSSRTGIYYHNGNRLNYTAIVTANGYEWLKYWAGNVWRYVPLRQVGGRYYWRNY